MMTINSVNGAADKMPSVCSGMNMQNDAVSKSIQDQIMNAQKRLQELGADKEMAMEEKMKRRQEIQQEIANLNQQLRQHQIEKRKEQQAQRTAAGEHSQNAATQQEAKQENGFSTTSMQAMISADSSLKQAKVQGSVATRMEGRAGVLKIEIKQDEGQDTSAKEAELAEAEQIASQAETAQMNTLAEANRTMEEAEKTEKKANETDTENKTDKADKKDDSAQETGEIRADADERAEDKASAKPEETTVSAESDVRPYAKKHIDMRL